MATGDWWDSYSYMMHNKWQQEKRQYQPYGHIYLISEQPLTASAVKGTGHSSFLTSLRNEIDEWLLL